MDTRSVLQFTPEVEQALASKKPVVALESTIVTHGMPFPENLKTALAVEEEVRAAGAIPATIAVMEGQIRIGLDRAALEALAQAEDVMKLSRADLAFALAGRRTGSTTVAATMMAAKLAGIEVFATGGIGGVHQGVEETLDISADLRELAQTSVITVCAGAKAILDIPRTLEVLETEGVPVVGYRTDELPAFWSRSSGISAPLRLDAVEDIAAFWRARKAIGQQGAILVANPVPGDSEIPADIMSGHIADAVRAAEAEGIRGKKVTPFLLGKILELTEGTSLAANIALIRNNARLAGEIAVALAATA
ncbi:MAG: pseudouridine-5'-phosphate glycosidase [Phyllobacteriaceae bacterium]|nr:pseudouridine-5'-phosphate glycosidase [Phyllobacteriaceae bacterium]